MYTPTKTPNTLSVKTVQEFFKDISKKAAPVLVVIDNKEYVLECLLEQKDSVCLYAGEVYKHREV